MKVKLGLYVMKPDDLANYGEAVHGAMVNHAAVFDSPSPTMTALAGLVAAVRNKVTAVGVAEDALKGARLELKDAVVGLRTGLIQEGSYVDYKAAGDATVVTLAGMKARAARSRVGPMPKVEKLKTIFSDYPGAVAWSCKPVPGAKAYISQYCVGDPGDEGNWQYGDTTTKASGLIQKLPGNKVFVRVCARGSDLAPGPWSDPAEGVVR